MGNNPSFYKIGDNYPIESVSWNDVQEFIRRLNHKTGKRYRLPTEAEWEYAARSGGKKEKWLGTSDESELEKCVWHYGTSENRINPVCQKRPNGLGLYDMSGNVEEWCQDWYDREYYKKSPRNNPKGPETGHERVIRVGCYLCSGSILQRDSHQPELVKSQGVNGFRLVLSAD